MGIVAAMVASGVQAAVITFSADETRIWNTPTAAADHIDTEGTAVVAINAGASSATVNGINFMDGTSGSATASGVTMAVAGSGGIWHADSGYTADPQLLPLLYDFAQSGYNSGDVSVDLSGLTVGQEYQLQFIFGQKQSPRSFTVQNAANASNTSPQYDNFDNDWGYYHFKAIWTADSTTQGFDMLSSNRAILNGASLLAIPEPATFGLVGMACTALLGFRRMFRM